MKPTPDHVTTFLDRYRSALAHVLALIEGKDLTPPPLENGNINCRWDRNRKRS